MVWITAEIKQHLVNVGLRSSLWQVAVKEQLHVKFPALIQPLPAPSADLWLFVLIHMSDLRMKRSEDDLKKKKAGETSQRIVSF